jgi:hypothetical protein
MIESLDYEKTFHCICDRGYWSVAQAFWELDWQGGNQALDGQAWMLGVAGSFSCQVWLSQAVQYISEELTVVVTTQGWRNVDDIF